MTEVMRSLTKKSTMPQPMTPERKSGPVETSETPEKKTKEELWWQMMPQPITPERKSGPVETAEIPEKNKTKEELWWQMVSASVAEDQTHEIQDDIASATSEVGGDKEEE